MAREGFVFYRSFAEAFKGLDASQYQDIMLALTAYALDGVEPTELDPVLYGYFVLIKPQIDANNIRRENGKKGAEYGVKGGRPKEANPEETPNKPQENPTQTPKEKEKVKVKEKEKEKENVKGKDIKTLSSSNLPVDDVDALFEGFWLVYPKKVGKGDARKVFSKINPGKKLVGEMISAVQKQSATNMWTRDNGRYIPNPSTWLNQQRWLDDIPPDFGKPDEKVRSPAKNQKVHNFQEREDDGYEDLVLARMKELAKGK